VSITGMAYGTDGRTARLINDGSNDIFLVHQSASSDAVNRIITPTGTDVTLGANAIANLIYDDNASRWRLTSTSQSGPSVEAISVDTTLSYQDVALVDASGGAVSITLPSGVTKPYSIKKTDSSVNAVTIVGTIDGDVNFDLIAKDEYINVVPSGANWFIAGA